MITPSTINLCGFCQKTIIGIKYNYQGTLHYAVSDLLHTIFEEDCYFIKLEVLDMFAFFNMSINCKVRIIIKYCSRALEHLFSLYWCHKIFTLISFTKTTFYKIFLHSFFCIANVHTKECHMLKLFSMRFSLNVMQ